MENQEQVKHQQFYNVHENYIKNHLNRWFWI